MFIPTTKEEIKRLGWDKLDIILITGDSYIDSPFVGVAMIGKVLLDAGYKVGIIAQPDVNSNRDITRFGKPRLFWGVSAGCIDSMVANYTPSGAKRRNDDHTVGGQNTLRPDRAVIAYSNLIRRYFKDTAPIVLGGIEASLRRIAHYDFSTNKIRRSVLVDAKADILIYGMAERAVLEYANQADTGADFKNIRGICYLSNSKPQDYVELPSYDGVESNKKAFARMFKTFYENSDPVSAKGLAQKQDTRFLIQNPPSRPLTQKELDYFHDLDFERDAHPVYKTQGKIWALDTIRHSITSHRGCYGECSFCSISVHQGRTVQSRSVSSIFKEASAIARLPTFKGMIHDVGGPTANMYGFECEQKLKSGACKDKNCMYPKVCKSLRVDHSKQLMLLKALKNINGITKIVVASGIRHDLVLADKNYGDAYLEEIVNYHVSGQMKVAPEHSQDSVLKKMRKPDIASLIEFIAKFNAYTDKAEKRQFLTYYLIAAHPGCTLEDMKALRTFALRELGTIPEQVQIFTPTPSTYSTLMYHTQEDPFTGEHCFVETGIAGRKAQKQMLLPLSRRLHRPRPLGSTARRPMSPFKRSERAPGKQSFLKTGRRRTQSFGTGYGKSGRTNQWEKKRSGYSAAPSRFNRGAQSQGRRAEGSVPRDEGRRHSGQGRSGQPSYARDHARSGGRPSYVPSYRRARQDSRGDQRRSGYSAAPSRFNRGAQGQAGNSRPTHSRDHTRAGGRPEYSRPGRRSEGFGARDENRTRGKRPGGFKSGDARRKKQNTGFKKGSRFKHKR
ncbi:YgiQ family radical SAM protein [Elusimicrobiota bacterium]